MRHPTKALGLGASLDQRKVAQQTAATGGTKEKEGASTLYSATIGTKEIWEIKSRRNTKPRRHWGKHGVESE